MVETLDEILRKALEYHGSDIFVVPGSQIMTKSSGKMIPVTQEKALPADIAVLVDRAYELLLHAGSAGAPPLRRHPRGAAF